MIRRRGFSLVETLISTLLLGVGVIGLVDLYTSSSRGMGSSRHRETATQIAVARMERLTTMPLDELPSCSGVVGCRADSYTMMPELIPSAEAFECTQYVSDMGQHDPRTRGGDGGYRLDTIVAPHPSSGQNGDARVVSVSVCWTDGDGDVQQVFLQSLALGDR
jgi:hypothetical protein